MLSLKPNILVITPVMHINGVSEILESVGQVTYMDDPGFLEVLNVINQYDVIYTNPNKSKVFIGQDIIDAGERLKVICTASTGTNHIDKDYAKEKQIKILALTEERAVINRISSTAELAFALTMTGIRHILRGHNAVMQGEWDYTRYIGRQMNCLTIGVIGYGRLGSMYAHYCQAFSARVLVYDPYKVVNSNGIEQVDNLQTLLKLSDVISLHVHVNSETEGMMNNNCFAEMKKDALLVNTSRGEIVNENDLVSYLQDNPQARVATDVLVGETKNRLASPVLEYAGVSEQVIITPHIGGMTREAQEIAYQHAAQRLHHFFSIQSAEYIND